MLRYSIGDIKVSEEIMGTYMQVKDLLEEKKFFEAHTLNQTLDPSIQIKFFSKIDLEVITLLSSYYNLNEIYDNLIKTVSNKKTTDKYLLSRQQFNNTFKKTYTSLISQIETLYETLDSLLQKETKDVKKYVTLLKGRRDHK